MRSEEKHTELLSELGHFLKGSSAALGVAQVQATCEEIQNLGKLWDNDKRVSISKAEALEEIKPRLVRVKKEYETAEKWLKNFYKEAGIEE